MWTLSWHLTEVTTCSSVLWQGTCTILLIICNIMRSFPASLSYTTMNFRRAGSSSYTSILRNKYLLNAENTQALQLVEWFRTFTDFRIRSRFNSWANYFISIVSISSSIRMGTVTVENSAVWYHEDLLGDQLTENIRYLHKPNLYCPSYNFQV